MDNKEQDSSALTKIFHPLQFAIIMILLVLVITLAIRYCGKKPEAATQTTIIKKKIAKKKIPVQILWKKLTVKPGDTLLNIFARAKINKEDYFKLIQIKEAKTYLAELKPKQVFHLSINTKNQLEGLIYNLNREQNLEITKSGDTFTVKTIKRTLEKKLSVASGTIQHSFFVAASKAELPNQLILSLADIFAWDIDFSQQIRPGDTFKVLYEQYYVDDKKVDPGNIIAAEITNNKTTYTAIRFQTPNDTTDYYTPSGRNLRRAFLRAPIKYIRISSPFNAKRIHPILHIVRPHEGVDLAAPTGAPIKASANGKIIFRGRKASYGKTVIIKHSQKYTTLYAHMSHFSNSLHVGSFVKQGRIIGYVGQTGLATGPHLHYEFHINNIPHDPMKVRLPNARSVPKNELATFKKQAKMALSILNSNGEKDAVTNATADKAQAAV